MKHTLNTLLLVLICLLWGCISNKPVNLSQQDMQDATQLFYKVLDKKIADVKGQDVQIEIIEVKKDPENLDTMHIEYALSYTMPEKKDEPEAKIQYAALATLQAFSKRHKLYWKVLKSEQKEYQMDFIEGIVIEAEK